MFWYRSKELRNEGLMLKGRFKAITRIVLISSLLSCLYEQFVVIVFEYFKLPELVYLSKIFALLLFVSTLLIGCSAFRKDMKKAIDNALE